MTDKEFKVLRLRHKFLSAQWYVLMNMARASYDIGELVSRDALKAAANIIESEMSKIEVITGL
jgi:hypothetical protein